MTDVLKGEGTQVSSGSHGDSLWQGRGLDGVEDVTLGDLVERAANAAPESLALIESDGLQRRWTYAGMLGEATQLAQILAGRCTKGDRIAVWARNCPEFAILQFGAALAGMILVPINPAFREGELEYVLNQSGAVELFYERSYRGTDMQAILDAVRPNTPSLKTTTDIADWPVASPPALSPMLLSDKPVPSDPALMLYTSGTTGFPKGAMLSHRGLIHSMKTVAESAGLVSGDVWLDPMPMFHMGGAGHGTVACAALGVTHVVMARFDPTAVLDAVERLGVASMLLVPTMLTDLLREPSLPTRELRSLRAIFSGGSSLSMDLAREVQTRLRVPLLNLFGQTESSGTFCQTRTDHSLLDRAETVGTPQPNIALRIVRPGTVDVVGRGESGEVHVCGVQQMLGYWKMPEATAEAFTGDGWLRTGDIGSMDDRGLIRVHARLKDMIIRGGENIYPQEIEELLAGHPAVDRVTVVGVPEDRLGEQVAAVLVLRDGTNVTSHDLYALCRAELAPHKTPTLWYQTDELPVTPSGKVRKFQVTKHLRDTGYQTLGEGRR